MPDPSPRRDLVIRTRLDVLKANLAQVKDVLRLAKRRGSEIGELQVALAPGPEGLAGLTRAALRQIGLALLDVDAPEKQADLRPYLEQAKDLLEQVQRKIHESTTVLDGLLRHRVAFGDTLLDPLKNQATHGELEFEALAEKLASGELQGLWEEYGVFFQTQGQPLFAEYVDFLRGLALREAGIDAGICQLLDLLLADRLKVGIDWRCLVIPDQLRPAAGEARRLVRLGFPEWTIWALPLAAQTLGHILVTEHNYLKKQVDELAAKLPPGVSREHLEDCLADAFALYAMGPAYGCAAILMQLDPTPPAGDGGRALALDRAATIFETWRLADKQAGALSFATELRERLLAEWTSAVEQARPQAAGAAAPADGAAAAAPPAAPAPVQEWCKRWWSSLEAYADLSAYRAEAWVKAQTWAPKLLVDQGREIETTDRDLRHVLNAAWCCRIDNAGRPELFPKIESAALAVWERMQSPAAPKGGLGSATDPRASRLNQAGDRKAAT